MDVDEGIFIIGMIFCNDMAVDNDLYNNMMGLIMLRYEILVI